MRYVMFPENTGNPVDDNENRDINRMLSRWVRMMTRLEMRRVPSGRRAKKKHLRAAEVQWLIQFKKHLIGVAEGILREHSA